MTSKPFLALLGLAALVVCGLTVRLWPRVAGPGVRALTGRLALLLTSQLALLLTFAALANAAFGFYTSWSDLFGVAPQHYQLTDAGRVQPDANAAQVRGNGSAATGPSHGEVFTATLAGLRSGITADLRVFLPPQYFAPSPGGRYFPAVVVDANAASDAAGLAAALLRGPLIRNPAVIVIVDGANGRSIPCADQPGTPSAELFWGQDLRTAIAARFRVKLSAASWGVLSTGPAADCAVTLALKDADRYSAAAVLGPWRQVSGAPADPAWWLRTYPAPSSRLLLADLGQSPGAALGPVRPPLQVTSATGVTEFAAVDWLAQTLQNGART